MASAWSASLAARPGYVAGTPTSSIAPSFVPLALPSVPTIDDSRAPGAAARSWDATQLANLPGKYNPLYSNARDSAQYRLAGYGGVKFGVDDPNTPQREDLQVSFDPNAKLGQREKQAVSEADMQALRSRDFYSSTHNQLIGSALVRMNEEKRAIVNQFSADINGIGLQQANESSGLIRDWIGLYGSDSQWLVDNPPPTPPAMAASGAPYTQDAVTASAAPYLGVPTAPAATGPNPLAGVNGAWGTTYQPPNPLSGVRGAWGTSYFGKKK